MASLSWAVPSMMNYQGILCDSNGDPITNPALDMVFRICSFEVGGPSLYEESQTVDVKDGVFSVILGTGTISIGTLEPSSFMFDDRWLEIGIGALPTPEVLSPRRPITSTAFAFQAGNADTLNGRSSTELDQSAHVSDTNNPHGVTYDQVGAAKEIHTHSASDITTGVLADERIPDGIMRDAEFEAADYGRSGVAGTLYEGTTSLTDKYVNQSGDVMTGSLEASYQGTIAYAVKGVGQFGPTNGYLGVQGADNFEGVGSTYWHGHEIGVVGISTGASSTDNYGVIGHATAVGVRGEHSTSGHYGELGTNNYGVYGTATAFGVYGTTTNGTGVFGGSSTSFGVNGISTSGYGTRGFSTDSTGVYGISNNSFGVEGVQNSSGNYGRLGTTNYGVQGVSSSGYGVSGHSSSGYGTRGFSTDSTGVYGISNNSFGVEGLQNSSGNYGRLGTTNYGVQGASSSGYGVYGNSTSGYGVYGYSSSSHGVRGYSANSYGVYAITGASGTYALYANGPGTGGAIYATSSTGTGIYATTSASSGDKRAGIFVSSTGTGLNGSVILANAAHANGVAMYALNSSASSTDATIVASNNGSGPLFKGFGGDGGGHEIIIYNDGSVDLCGGAELKLRNGAEAVTIRIDPQESGTSTDGGQITLYNAAGAATIEIDGDYIGDGRITTQELAITGGSDISEQFNIRAAGNLKDVLPGMVVSIDPSHPGELVVSTEAYDRKVAGIVSGAGGVKPGMLMGQRGSEADGCTAVALTGRVYCWADATYGPIQPGDLLTSSDKPGHAMKVTDHAHAMGATLGKAMTSLESGQGLVLVLVCLQ